MRLVSYARQSKTDKDSVPSTEWQRTEMERWAGERGHLIVASFADNDKSGYRAVVRPEFDRTLEAMGAPDVDGAIVWQLDRLSRKGPWGEDVIRFMEAKGAKELLSVTEDIDTTTAEGELILSVRLSINKGTSQAISRQWKRAKRAAAEAGRPSSGGHRWFGWTRGFDLEPTEAALLRDAAERMMSGGTLRGIVLAWNDAGVLSSTGRPWTHQALRGTLRSYRLAGLREWQGELIEGTWPAILDRDTVDRLRRVLDDPARRRGGAPVTSLLGGLLRCGRCDTRMRAGSRSSTGRRRYQCPGGGDGCGGCAIITEDVDREVGLRMIAYLAELGPEPARPDLAPIVTAIETVDARLSKLAVDHYDLHKIEEVQFFAASKALTVRKAELKSQVAAMERGRVALRLVGDPRSLAARWGSMDVEEKRAILSTYVESISIGAAVRGRNFFDPDRVKVKWS